MKIFKKIKEYIPTPALVIYGIFLFGTAIAVASRMSTAFADLWNETVAAFLRAVFAYATTLLPFSLAEYILLCLPVIMTVLIVYAFKNTVQSNKKTVRYIASLVSAGALVFSVLFINFTAGYFASPIDEKLGLDKQPVSAEELYETSLYLLENVNRESKQLDYIHGSFSVMPYSLGELSDKINDAYAAVCDEHDFIQRLNTSVKPVMLSKPWTYTHVAGVYTFFTGEANINTNFPDYTLPFTVAHEMAHQRGISREDEANFIAFLVCIASNDPYIRYSGYLSVYEYTSSALYSSDEKLYYKVLSEMDARVRGELIAYNDFFEEYKDNVAETIVGGISDAYLQQQGQSAGIRSYNLVTDLAVAWFKQNVKPQAENSG